jgi:integrase
MPIELRRNKDGNLKSKWWYGSYQANGKRHVVNLGVAIAGKVPRSLRTEGNAAFEQSRGEALAALKRQQHEAMTRKSAAAQLEQIYEIRTGEKVGSIMLGAMADEWKKAPHARERSKRYVEQSLATIKHFVKFIGDNHPSATTLDRVNRKMGEAWLASLEKDKICPATYSDKLVLMRSVFKVLRHGAGMAWNPFEGLPTKNRQTTHRQPFTAAELKKIIENAEPLLRPVLITGISTAMRRGDCCLLKWSDVDLDQGFVVVKTSKTGETAEIPIFPMLKEELEKAQAARGQPAADSGQSKAGGGDGSLEQYVWPEAAAMFLQNRYGITWRTQKAIENAGITETLGEKRGKRRASVKDFHSLRTTWITMALSAGVPMELVRRVTGHATTDVVLKHYFRPGRKDFRKALKNAMPKMLTDGGGMGKEAEVVSVEPATPAAMIRAAVEALEKQTGRNWKAKRDEALQALRTAAEWVDPSSPRGGAAP